MRSKYFFIKIFGIVFLIMVVILYFLLYFFPSVEAINLYKRQFKDANLKISDFIKEESAFSFSSEAERNYFVRVEQELKSKIPEVGSREDFITLFTNISNYIQKLAEQDGIFNLVLKSDARELKVNASTLSTDKKTLSDLISFAARRLARLRKEQQFEADRRMQPAAAVIPGQDAAGDLSFLVKGLKYNTISLSFTGELKNAMNFVNHIPWSPYYLSEDKILISIGDIFPYYIVFLKIYYIDHRNDTGAGKQP